MLLYKNYKMKSLQFSIYITIICISLTSCKKDFLNTQPTDQISEADAFKSIANARAALNGVYRGLYRQYASQSQDGHPDIMISYDFMGEDVVHFAAGTTYFRGSYRWVDHRSEASALNEWVYRFYYQMIANANMIISNIDGVPGTEAEKNDIKGQALALRAWCHYYLVQCWGIRYEVATKPNNQPGVPIVLKNTTEPLPRASVEDVYAQINKDLDDAITNLTGVPARINKTYINLNVAKGFKARVALTMQNWEAAAQLATEAREGMLMSNTEYLSGFNNLSNPEWMWGANQLPDQLPSFGSFFAYMSGNFNSAHTRPNPKLISSKLYALISATDIRKKLWWDGTTADLVNFGVRNAATGMPEPSARNVRLMHRKYMVKDLNVSAGDIPFMRLAEMYLIEAEARARLGQNGPAADALFTLVKNRDAAYVKSTKTGQALVDEILIHRRIELWGEGFRYLDLKRTNSALDRTGTGATTTLANLLTVPAGDKIWQFLIPRREIQTNPTIEQNPL
jgi:hypothetical protein